MMGCYFLFRLENAKTAQNTLEGACTWQYSASLARALELQLQTTESSVRLKYSETVF
jgi:hypothetical protein